MTERERRNTGSYGLVAARRESQPDSDPPGVKSKVIDLRFQRVEERHEELASTVKEIRSDVADLKEGFGTHRAEIKAMLRAYGAAFAGFVTLIGFVVTLIVKFWPH